MAATRPKKIQNEHLRVPKIRKYSKNKKDRGKCQPESFSKGQNWNNMNNKIKT